MRLRPFLVGDMGGVGLLRVLGMVVRANGAAVTDVTKRDNIMSSGQHRFSVVCKHRK